MPFSEPEAISPELVLVSPELRARAIAALPDPAERAASPGLEAAPDLARKTSTRVATVRTLTAGLARFVEIGIFTAAVVAAAVLCLTLVADALR